MKKKSNEIPKISPTQFALAFHKFINKERNASKWNTWNKLDEDAYYAALTGIFEFKPEEIKIGGKK
jgi:hypothetical protein